MSDERTRDRLLIEAGLSLASELDLDALLDRLVELAVELTDARYGALGVLTSDGTGIERFVTRGMTEVERAAIGDPPVGHGLLGVLIDRGQVLRIPDIAADPRSGGFPPHHPPMRSFIGAPISALGGIFGNLYLTDKAGGEPFTKADEDAVMVLATQAGVAVENARLMDETQRAERERRRLEVLEERERIAKELHDGVIQSLFAVGMGLQGTASRARDADVAHQIEGAVEEVDRSIRDLRNYIFGLRPGILADRQLDQALQLLGEEFQERSGVLTVVDVRQDLASELASRAPDIVQLVREALSNVGRHASATTCRVSLRRSDGAAELEIDDDGTGFDPTEPRSGMGLANLEARVARLGGTLEIASVLGEGTTVRARLPI
jgi:two-component system, NarL family, sensor histidine kinase DevS